MTSRMNVVPRSSPSITSMAKIAAPGSSGISRCRQSVSWPDLLLAGEQVGAPEHEGQLGELRRLHLEAQPTLIQRSAPSTVVADSQHQQQAEHGRRDHAGRRRPGTAPGEDLAATHISGSPTATPSNCFWKLAYGDPPWSRAWADEVDSTMIRPSASSSRVQPRTR